MVVSCLIRSLEWAFHRETNSSNLITLFLFLSHSGIYYYFPPFESSLPILKTRTLTYKYIPIRSEILSGMCFSLPPSTTSLSPGFFGTKSFFDVLKDFFQNEVEFEGRTESRMVIRKRGERNKKVMKELRKLKEERKGEKKGHLEGYSFFAHFQHPHHLTSDFLSLSPISLIWVWLTTFQKMESVTHSFTQVWTTKNGANTDRI